MRGVGPIILSSYLAAKAAIEREETNQKVVALGSQGGINFTEWAIADSNAVEQKEVRLRIQRVRMQGNTLRIHLFLENLGKIDVLYQTWGIGNGPPLLQNDVGLKLRLASPSKDRPAKITIPSRQAIADVLEFEGPLDQTQYLRLELPASAFGGKGKLRVQIPENMLLFATALSQKEKALQALVTSLTDKDPEVRHEAASVLAAFGRDAWKAVPALTDSLHDSDASVRQTTAVALGKIGGAAKPALRELLKSLADQNEEVRQAAARAIELIGLPDFNDLIMLRLAMKETDSRIRAQAVYMAGQMGVGAKNAIPELIASLRDKDPSVRGEAATALGLIGQADSIPALRNALGDDAKSVRLSAIRSLAMLSPAPGTLPGLLDALGDKEPEISGFAETCLTKVNRVSNEDMPFVLRALESTTDMARISAFSLLGKGGSANRETVTSLIKGLKDKTPRVRQIAATTLGEIGPAAGIAAMELGNIATDKDEEVRKAAISALGSLGPNAGPGVSALLPALLDGHFSELIAATLVKIGKPAVPDLVDELEKKGYRERLTRIVILGKIGPNAAEAIPALSKCASSDAFPTVRRAAEESLSKIRKK
jgi:HEAT repeat protein